MRHEIAVILHFSKLLPGLLAGKIFYNVVAKAYGAIHSQLFNVSGHNGKDAVTLDLLEEVPFVQMIGKIVKSMLIQLLLYIAALILLSSHHRLFLLKLIKV